jgi:hypothetical protein
MLVEVYLYLYPSQSPLFIVTGNGIEARGDRLASLCEPRMGQPRRFPERDDE